MVLNTQNSRRDKGHANFQVLRSKEIKRACSNNVIYNFAVVVRSVFGPDVACGPPALPRYKYLYIPFVINTGLE